MRKSARKAPSTFLDLSQLRSIGRPYPRAPIDAARGMYRIAAKVEKLRHDVRSYLTSVTTAAADVRRECLPNGRLAAQSDSVTHVGGRRCPAAH